jgi:hypothetical protein
MRTRMRTRERALLGLPMRRQTESADRPHGRMFGGPKDESAVGPSRGVRSVVPPLPRTDRVWNTLKDSGTGASSAANETIRGERLWRLEIR